MAYGVLGAIAFVVGLWLVVKLAVWSAKREGIELAHNDILKAGTKTDAKTQDILARPPADRDAIDKWLRGGGK